MSEHRLIDVFPSLPRIPPGFPVVLGSTPCGNKIQYCNGNFVYTIPIVNITIPEIYTEHACQTTVAKTSPSGFYCASGDNQGNVRIWDTTQSTHILKHTLPVFSGPVRDIAWDSESKRIAAVGEGKERFGHVFLLETTTSNGSLIGQSRPMNCVDFKPTRPLRIISGSDDKTVAIFEGPPFNFKTTFNHHSSFVFCTKYSPDGSLFASAGSGGLIFLYNGTDGSKVGVLMDDNEDKKMSHSRSIYGLAWSPDGSRIASASADRTVKIWDVASKKLKKSILIGSTVFEQQVGIVWTKEALISVACTGFLNFLNPEKGFVEQIRRGHNKGITCLAKSCDEKFFHSADAEGNICTWEVSTGKATRFNAHSSIISGLQATTNRDVYSVGWDNELMIHPTDVKDPKDGVFNTPAYARKEVKLSSQPRGLAVSNDVAIIACHQHIDIIENSLEVHRMPIDFHSTCVAFLVEQNLVAVGGEDGKVRLYKLKGDNEIEPLKVLEHGAKITSVSFSNNGEYLAVTDDSRKVIPYNVASDFAVAHQNSWKYHTAKITSVAWSPDNCRLATGSVDNSVIVWNIKKPGDDPVIIRAAHATVNAVLWTDETTIVSAGQDANIKIWTVPA